MTRLLATAASLFCLFPSLPAQVAVAEPTPADLVARLGSQLHWLVDDPRLIEEGSNRRQVMESARASADFDRGAAMDKALAEAKKTGRPVFWFVPRITASTEIISRPGAQMYRPAVLDRYARAVLFTDPDLVTLINERCVPARLICDQKLGERFGIAAPDVVEPAFLLLDGEGRILRRLDRLRSFNANWFWRVLAHELGVELPDKDAALPENVRQKIQALVDRAAALRRHLRLDEALRILESAEAAAAELPRQSSRGRRGRSDPLEAAIACERGRVFLLDGKVEVAATAFVSVHRGAHRAEALYHLGLCDFFNRNETFALRRWKEAVDADPDSPWAWKAAANLIDGEDLTSYGPALHGFEDPFATSAPVTGCTSTERPRSPEEAEALAREGVRFLIRMQRENGGWTDSRYAYWPSPEITPNAWVAITSLACTALLEWRHLDPEKVDEAIRLGERYMFDERHMNRGFNEEVYSDAYKLFYLARKHDLASSSDERRQTVDRMNGIVRELMLDQEGDSGNSPGFWGHEYPNGFTTAAVMNALHLVKERGARVPDTVMEAGAKALLSIRNKDGAYSYGSRGTPPEGSDEALKNSMARSPICEAVLLWAGDSAASEEHVAAALDNFWKYLPRLEKIRTCDFHTDGELGGFFFWHGLFHTTESIKALPEAEREPHQNRMIGFLTGLGELDGSFIDSHEMGKSYGTAMGLLSLQNALRVKH